MQMEQAACKPSHVFGTNMADLDLSNLSDMLKAYWSTAVYVDCGVTHEQY